MKLHNNPQPSIAVEAQATYYSNMISVYIPKSPFYRKPSSDPTEQNSGRWLDEETTEGEADSERSLRRTKKKIGDYILCNSFELFVTFTFAKNRQDINQKRRQMSDAREMENLITSLFQSSIKTANRFIFTLYSIATSERFGLR